MTREHYRKAVTIVQAHLDKDIREQNGYIAARRSNGTFLEEAFIELFKIDANFDEDRFHNACWEKG